MERFLKHLQQHGVDTHQVIITTDLETKFDGDTTHCRPERFHRTIQESFGAEHRFNPPACPNANADVERVHNTIETQLFEAQVCHCRGDCFAKAATYQLWYNAARKNSSRADKSPADLLARKAPHLSPKIFLLHPTPLELLLLPQGGARCTGTGRRTQR